MAVTEILSLCVSVITVAFAVIRVSAVINKLEAADDRFTLTVNGILERQEHSKARMSQEIGELRQRILTMEEHLLKTTDFKK